MDDIDRAQRQNELHLAQSLAAHANRPRPPSSSAGVCVDCGEPIPEARRKAARGCTRCISCQRQAEQSP